jgi:3-deoxy-D-arabino-heptulosonate 7-phosphate (DAHP) synthase
MDYECLKTNGKIIIAGPCALESREQLIYSVNHLKETPIKILRACLWKPRTVPGWEGLGFFGMPMLMEETIPKGIMPATEIFTTIHAQMVVDGLKQFNPESGMLVWIGARNQNHFELRRMAQILTGGPEGLFLMFKNQMWYDKKHWIGIFEHILNSGFPPHRLIACHRGFHPGYSENPKNLRNIPDFQLAMEMKEKMGIPMLIDPSHIAGSRQLIMAIVEESLNYCFDGYMLETHHNISTAKTDVDQQLTFDQLKDILAIIGENKQKQQTD